MLAEFDAIIKKFFGGLLAYYTRFYGLPSRLLEKKIKRRLGLSYTNKTAQFSPVVRLGQMPKSALLFVGMLIKILITSRPSGTPRNYSLVVRDIHTDDEMNRLMPMFKLFARDGVLILLEGDLTKDYPFEIVKDRNFTHYIRSLSIKTALKELFIGLPFYIIMSLYTRVNLFHFSTRIINDYLRYSSLANRYRAGYVFTERCIKISPMLRFLYQQKVPDAKTMTVQKSLLAADQTSFYYDIDCFFSLGTTTADRALQYGGHIGEIVPTGSIFSHQRLPDLSAYSKQDYRHEYDLVLIGMNVMNNYSRFDTHDSFLEEYYGAIGWLDQLKTQHPDLRIAIKHHASASQDPYEDALFQDSQVEFVDKTRNSYEVAFSAKVAVTYGSTMGYELLALGKPCIFLDPGCGNFFIDDCDTRPEIDQYRCKTYAEFEAMAMQLMDTPEPSKGDISNVCLPPHAAFDRISEFFNAS